MGWETVAIIGFQALSSAQGMSAANKQAKGITAQGAFYAKQAADKTVQGTGKLKTSFLQSGLTLDGGPMDVLTAAFNKGYTDISQIKTNADNAAKNVVSAARSKALMSLASSAAGAFGSSGFSDFADNVGSGFTSMGNGTGFDLGYQASSDFQQFGGGFGPGEFV